MLIALLLAVLPQTTALHVNADPIGAWTINTVLNDQPGTMRVDRTRRVSW
jgi:hypothetical protein